MISNSLTGKLAIITGAASGMGKATAHLFSKHGADLILIDKSENINQIGTEIRMAGAKVHSIVADLTESSRVKAAFDEIKSVRWWPSNKLATILVNSAGNGYTKAFLKLTEKEFNETLDINLKSTFLMTQRFCQNLVENFHHFDKSASLLSSYGSIINLSGQGAYQRSASGTVHYAASKAAVDGLTRSVSAEMGPYRVRCNSVVPFFIETPLISFVTEEQRKQLIRATSLGRLGKPEEVAQLILFLASDASSYITGACIDITG